MFWEASVGCSFLKREKFNKENSVFFLSFHFFPFLKFLCLSSSRGLHQLNCFYGKCKYDYPIKGTCSSFSLYSPNCFMVCVNIIILSGVLAILCASASTKVFYGKCKYNYAIKGTDQQNTNTQTHAPHLNLGARR